MRFHGGAARIHGSPIGTVSAPRVHVTQPCDPIGTEKSELDAFPTFHANNFGLEHENPQVARTTYDSIWYICVYRDIL